METKISGNKVWLCVGEVKRGPRRKKKAARARKGGKRSATELHRLRLKNLAKGRLKKARIKRQRLANLKKARAASKRSRARR